MTPSRLPEAVYVVVGAQQRRLGDQYHSGLLGDLPRYRCEKTLFWIDTTCGDLRAGFGIVPVLEDQKLRSPLDVDDNALPTFHAQIVKTDAMRERKSRFAALGQCSGMTPEP